jgi:hypothetical protein
MNKFFIDNPYANSNWGKTYNIMSDINAAGYTWKSAYIITGDNNNDGIVIDGHGNTITGLTINGGYMFSGTPCGGNDGVEPGVVKNLTMDGVVLNSNDWFTGIFWGNVSSDLVMDNVHVVNSTVSGINNVGALVGSTGEFNGSVNITFKDCSVKNTAITARGANGQDPTGASAFIGRAYAKTALVFEGKNVVENNTFVNENGLVGGGIYGYTVLGGSGFVGTGTCDSFTNWNGLSAVESANDLSDALASGDDVVLSDDLTVTGSVVTTNGVTEAYGNKIGVAQYGGTLDGNGNTLTETGSSAYVIVTHGGTIKNLTIVGGGRGIVIYAPTEDVIIDNVVIDGPGYAINTAEHNGQNLIVTNSTLNGWTSLAGLDSVSLTNCKSGENSTKCWQNYGYDADYDRLIRPYGQTSFTDCTFE